MKPEAVALRFVEAINSRDADRLADVMTDDHVYVDSDGSEHSGRAEMRRGWTGYYEMVPDFRIYVEQICASGNVVGMFGTAEGTFADQGVLKPENHWHVPTAWRAVIEGDLVARWQLYVNPVPMLDIHRRITGSGIESA
jgi:uncharacterized protein (TIGR02246 family)